MTRSWLGLSRVRTGCESSYAWAPRLAFEAVVETFHSTLTVFAAIATLR